ncbi:methyltransferase domain-containing protein [Marixanthomonas spongiae]|uniref:Class I SAM-dependent methyltransferase n=1 Tax=Marixanthomonas spongiae TaxID=2174845 RepID=A0A2U0I1Z8_9FLAO|nr:methyltransferase domain-containing protein [Marixanthomonas spongiae]PVW15132.1 class I SAM-dependent methyltransferase [Marixanthomonas spongiae]
MNIKYRHTSEFPGWEKAPELLLQLIETYNAQKVLEIGSGANPTLTPDIVSKSGITYTTNDVSGEELLKASKVYSTWKADLCTPDIAENHSEKYQLIFSRMVNEHIKDGETYYKNLYDLLEPNGVTAHCFSTLYALPFLVNRILPENFTDKLLNFFNPRTDRHQHEKFPAYYSWSRGPSRKSIKRFEALGFEVIEYIGFFGHGYYRKKVPFLDYLEQKKAHWLVKNPVPALTGYAYIVLKKVT